MKGLFCSHLDRKDEAHEFIKKGIRQDITSHICKRCLVLLYQTKCKNCVTLGWHVYGLFHRAEKNYPEALKCYGQALKFDKENQQIARDHSLLQVQMRMYDSFCESKYDMLQSRPKMRGNWTGLAIAYHLLGKYDLAAQTLTTFEESFKVSTCLARSDDNSYNIVNK